MFGKVIVFGLFEIVGPRVSRIEVLMIINQSINLLMVYLR